MTTRKTEPPCEAAGAGLPTPLVAPPDADARSPVQDARFPFGASMRAGSDFLGDLFGRIADAGKFLTGLNETREADLTGLCDTLVSGRGEATGLAIACTILDRYAALTPAQKAAFFGVLSARFGVDLEALRAAYDKLQGGDAAAARAVHVAAEPKSQELLRRLNRAPGGTARLVAMRADLLEALPERPDLKPLDEDFRHLFTSWFNRGFLHLRRIDWGTSALILEKIIRFEAVHAIQGWDDLRRRVAASDRRLYGFFHPALPDEPLVFVEVALTDQVPAAIGPILAEDRTPLDPAGASTAVFYSISNCQAGLRGVSFGSFLIKQVVEDLRREFAGLRTFVTLSPVPGLRAWAGAAAAGGQLPDTLAAAVAVLEADQTAADGDAALAQTLAELAARYLVTEKAARGGARDAVARFHLGNGARLERLNIGADKSARGRGNAWGVMVNYLYDLDAIERNHETYAGTGEVVCARSVRRLIKAG